MTAPSSPRNRLLLKLERAERYIAGHRAVFTAIIVAILVLDGLSLVVRDEMGDFNPVFRASSRLARGEPPYVPEEGAAFVYSPIFALVAYPLHWLGLKGAKALWYLTCVFLFFLSIRTATRLVWGSARPE